MTVEDIEAPLLLALLAANNGDAVACTVAVEVALSDRDTLREQLAAGVKLVEELTAAVEALKDQRDKLQRAYDESAQKADSHRRLYERARGQLEFIKSMANAAMDRAESAAKERDELRAKAECMLETAQCLSPSSCPNGCGEMIVDAYNSVDGNTKASAAKVGGA